MTNEELEKMAAESKKFVGMLASAPHVYESITSYESGFKDGYRMCEKRNGYKTPDVSPDSFGDYLVVIDEEGCGRRCAFRQYIKPQPTDEFYEAQFGVKKQVGWILGEHEKLAYWMEIPDWG